MSWLKAPLIQIHTRWGYWQPTRLMSVISLAFVFLCSQLGLWQWHKAQAKEALTEHLARFQASIQNRTLDYAEVLKYHQQYAVGVADTPFKITGFFVTKPLILQDNRIHQGQAGFHLLAFFKTDPDLPDLLVNLGFHPWPQANRAFRPVVRLPSTPIQLQGLVYLPPKNPFELQEDKPQNCSQAFLLIQQIHFEALSKLCNQNLAPLVLNLSSDSLPLPGFNRNWPKAFSSEITADKHRGYALQWATFAIIALVLFVVLNFKQGSDVHE